jgi:putative serine protease PepD
VNTITGNVGVGTWTSAVRLTADDDPTATGGPIINDSGALVGIAVSGVTTGRDSDPERRQYGIDAGIAVTVARNVATTGVALHGRIGAEVSDEEAGVLGARITDVADASPAKTAGLRDGDIIVSYNGSRIGSAAQLVAAVRGTDPGTKADVAFLRDGHERTVRVQITASQ